ncbi:MAG: hypothetical protein EOP53_28265, partial [Sphingobacteriales bacterium]
MVIDFLNGLADKGFKLSVYENQLNCYAPEGSLTNDIRDRIIEHKQTIIDLLSGTKQIKSSSINNKEFPLSVGEKGLYILQNIHPEMSAYNIPLCFKISRNVDVDMLEKSWASVQEQYPILKTRIHEK